MLSVSAVSPFATFSLLAFGARTAWAGGGSGGGSGGNVLNELPSCWDQCSQQVSGSDCTWYETNCICNLANNTPYLAKTISCAQQSCNSFSSSQVDKFLSPIEFSCSLAGGLSQSRLNAAQAAAKAPQSSSNSHETTAKPTSTEAPTTLKTTLKATTTDSKGNTAVIELSMQYGPSGVETGKVSTSLMTVSIIPVPASSSSSAAAKNGGSTTTAAGIAVAAGTPTASGSSSTSASALSTSQAGGGGTLFDSQGGATGLTASRSCTIMVVAGLASFLFAVAL